MTASVPGGLRTRTLALAVAGVALTGVLAACGSGGGDATTSAGSSPSASPTGGPGEAGPGGRPGGFAGLDLQAVRSCLSAAGITLPAFPTNRGSFTGTGRPSFSRNPSFTGRPTGTAFPGGGRGGGAFAVLQTPEAKAALEACGITVPTFTPRNRPSQPTSSPSS
jgi:hypothetical protein